MYRGAGKLILTSVTMRRSAGFDEEGRCVLVGVDEEDGGAVARK
jgi:hypothetical protein